MFKENEWYSKWGIAPFEKMITWSEWCQFCLEFRKAL